jgi:hypothetical protein
MRRMLGIAAIVLLIAVGGVLAFKDELWPDSGEPRQGAGGRAGDNIPKKRTGG